MKMFYVLVENGNGSFFNKKCLTLIKYKEVSFTYLQHTRKYYYSFIFKIML